MKNIRFKYVFLLMFALLFANLLSIKCMRVEAEEIINSDKFYRGEKMGYWAQANYGDDLVGKDTITIFLDPEAIDNKDINYILISETNMYGEVETVYYQRGVDSQFAARFNYTFTDSTYGPKSIVIQLMGSLEDGITEYIEKIRIDDLERVRTIEYLDPDDFLITREVEDDTPTSKPYMVYISIKENPQDYRLESALYSYMHTNGDDTQDLLSDYAIYEEDNYRFRFVVSENSTYNIVVKDRFGFEVGLLPLVITNFEDVINVVATYDKAYTREDVSVKVDIYNNKGLPYTGTINAITVTNENGDVLYEDIKNIRTFTISENGVYIITCYTADSYSFTEINITNIDRIAPTVIVSDNIKINSSDVEKTPYAFDPYAQVIATDNATKGDDLIITAKYYYVSLADETCKTYQGNVLDKDIYLYLFSVNDVCVEYEVVDEARNSKSVLSKITVTDNTKPVISFATKEMTLEIGDDVPTNDELMDKFGLSVSDNSRIFNPERELYIESDLSALDLTTLGVYDIYINAVDGSGNEGDSVKFVVTVTVRILRIAAVPNQYIVYGDEMIDILYTCNGNPCEEEILPRDFGKLVGELYISNGSIYAGTYNIHSNLSINSENYKIELGNLGVFTIKKRAMKIIANSFSIDYLDEEPTLTWYMDTSVCAPDGGINYTGDINALDYTCTFVEGDEFGGGAGIDRVENGITYYKGAIRREEGKFVKFDDAKNVTYYKIYIGDLKVKEANGGGFTNYYLDFYGLYDGVLYKDYARFYIYPKYVEVTIKDVTKIYGEADPSVDYLDELANAKQLDGVSNSQYEFSCRAYKPPINAYTTQQCLREIQFGVSREPGEGVGQYKIIGTFENENYDVRTNEEFDVSPIGPAYLNVVPRDITVSVDGDPIGSGKYKIIYEDKLPNVTVSVTNDPDNTYQGLARGSYQSIVDGTIISFFDELSIGEKPIKYLNSNGEEIGEYVAGIGLYDIVRNQISISNKDGEDVIENYNLTFNKGVLEVIQRRIYIKVIDGLSKIYGDAEPDFSDYVIDENSNYVVDGNKRFILQIYDSFENEDIIDEDDYEPLDKNKLKYFMKRDNLRVGVEEVDVHDGEMVGEYLVKCDHFENDTNYIINVYGEYYFTITRRTMYISINDSQTEFNYQNKLPKFSYAYTNNVFGDSLVGQPGVSGFSGTYRNNGNYTITQGNITALSSMPLISSVGETWYINGEETNVDFSDIPSLDVTLIEIKDGRYYFIDIENQTSLDSGVDVSEVNVMWNYKFEVDEGNLEVIARNVVIIPGDGKTKQYGDNDPTLSYRVKHWVNGVVIDEIEPILDPSDFVGNVTRVSGEKPGDYEINGDGLSPALKGSGYNFNIIAVEAGHKFTITRRDLTLRLAAAVWDEDEGIYKVELAYGDSLDILATGYRTMDGTSEANNPSLCTMETLNGSEVCHAIYDTITGQYGVQDNLVPENVGRYILVKGDLRLVRVINPEINVSEYYNFNFIEVVLEIMPRVITITPHSGQSKYYGDNDRTETVVIEGCGIGFDYDPTKFVKNTDKFSGCLQRLSKFDAQGNETREDVGQYILGLGTLKINDNYELVLNGSIMYEILPRTLIVTAVVTGPTVKLGANDYSYTMQYEPYDETNPPFEIGYILGGMGLADNVSLGIKDEIVNNVILDPSYVGVGTYKVKQGELIVTNSRNYVLAFNEATFIVTKKIVTIVPVPMSKIYGEDDPEAYLYTIVENNIPTPTGALSRIPGQDANKYKITIGTLSFGDNYIMDLQEGFFVINPRKVTIKAKPASKVYDPTTPDPIFEYEPPIVEGGFTLDIPFSGRLSREDEDNQEVGEYEIIQNTLALNSNYEITYISAIYEIYYVDITSLEVKLLDGDRYQLDGEETPVSFYAQFNAGANPEFLHDVTWSVVKSGGFPVTFTRDTNNIIEFTPHGIGTYTVTANYNGLTGTYQIFVQTNNVSEIFIRLTNGSATQIWGLETELTYSAEIHLFDDIDQEINIEWFAGGYRVCTHRVTSTSDSCSFTPSQLGVGEFSVYAKISNVISDSLKIIIKDNEIPQITLVDQGVIYYIEAHPNATENSRNYMEPGYSAYDDVEGDISDRVVVKGLNIDYNKVGTYHIIYEVSDKHGHVANNYRTVIVQDTVAPVVKLDRPELIEIVLEYGEKYEGYGGASAEDAYDKFHGKTVDVMIDSNLDESKIGRYEIIYFAVDSNGNRGQVTRVVVIKDTTPPHIALIGDENVYIEYQGVYRDLGAWFEDNYDGTYRIYASSITFTPEGSTEPVPVASVDTNVLGTYRLSYYQTDSSGNAPLTFPVRNVFVQDNTPPQIILKGSNPFYLRYGTEYVDPGYEVIDNYDTGLTATVREVIGNTLGTYYVYYDAIDSHNNRAKQVVRTIILVDLVSPTLAFTDMCPQYITIEALSTDPEKQYNPLCDTVDYGYTVYDDYIPDQDLIKDWVKITNNINSELVGEYTVVYSVSDRSNNTATLTRYVSVVDTTPPEVTLLPNDNGDIDFFVEVFGRYDEPGWEVKDIYDDYHGIEISMEVVNNININKLNTYTIMYIATDSNGNESIPVYREITVLDAIPPEVTLIGDPTIIIERGMGAYAEYGATAKDNYDGVIEVRPENISEAPTGKEIGEFEVHYCVSDSSGNEGCATRQVIVQDTIAPVIYGVENGAYYRNPVYIYYSPLVGTDEVLTGTLNGELITSPWYVSKEGIYHLEVHDDADNYTTIDFVIDMTAPVLYGANNGEYINHPVTIYALEELKLIGYRFDVGGYVTINEQTLYLENEGQYWVYAIDMAGNESERISFIIDTTPPIYSLLGVENGGITNTDVTLNTEPDMVVSVNNKYIPTSYRFSENGYYQVVIRDLANNDVFLQFVINRDPTVKINNKDVSFISQNNAIGKFIAKANAGYPKGAGFIYAKPLLNGGFEYISGTLFSDEEYNKLINGEDISFDVPNVASDEMVVAFVVNLDELNKFTTQTVEGDDDSAIIYAVVAIAVAGLIGGFFYFFVVVKRKKDEEEDEEEIIEEDVYY